MRRRGFKHPLGDHPLPNPISGDELQFCYKMLRHSEHHWGTAAQIMLESHIRLGMSTVGYYVAKHPSKTDLLVAEMLFSLWKSTLKMHTGAIDHHDVPNPVGYMMSCLKGDLLKLLHSDGLMRVNVATYKKILQKGEPHRVLFFDLTNEIKRQAYAHQGDLKQLEEMVFQKSCESDREREIINLRLDGLRDEEIGKKLDPPLTKQRVYQIRMKIAEKLKRMIDHD